MIKSAALEDGESDLLKRTGITPTNHDIYNTPLVLPSLPLSVLASTRVKAVNTI